MVRTAAADRLLEAAPEDVGMSSAGLERVSRLVQRYVDAGRIPGGISAVVRRGRLVHFETYGSMNDDAGQAMQPDAIFRIYSMTKPIVSIALMMLLRRGPLPAGRPGLEVHPAVQGPARHGQRRHGRQLRDAGARARDDGARPAHAHLGPRRARRRRRRRTSPWPSSTGAPPSRAPTRAPRCRARSTSWATLPLKCDPGSEWNYGVSTDVVGYLIEVLSGQRLDDFVARAHPRPAGHGRYAASWCRSRRSTASPPTTATWPATSTSCSTRPATASTLKPPTFLSGAGGMVSTAADYLRFVKMLANGGELDGVRIIGPRTLQLMAMNHLLGRPRPGVDELRRPDRDRRATASASASASRCCWTRRSRRPPARRASTTGAVRPRRRSSSRRRRTWPWSS